MGSKSVVVTGAEVTRGAGVGSGCWANAGIPMVPTIE